MAAAVPSAAEVNEGRAGLGERRGARPLPRPPLVERSALAPPSATLPAAFALGEDAQAAMAVDEEIETASEDELTGQLAEDAPSRANQMSTFALRNSTTPVQGVRDQASAVETRVSKVEEVTQSKRSSRLWRRGS